MTRRKTTPTASIVRSSAAEYLTFVAATGDQSQSFEMRYEGENVWLTQKMRATLYDVTVPAINQHLKRLFADRELEEQAVVKQYLITATDGKSYDTKHYNLSATLAVEAGAAAWNQKFRSAEQAEYHRDRRADRAQQSAEGVF